MSTLSVLLQLAFWSALACVGATSLHTIVPSVDGVPGKCIFRVQKEDGSLISYDFSKHMHDLVSDDLEGYRVKMNLCGEVAASCYPSTCSKQDGAHDFDGTPCLPWNATENEGRIIVERLETGGPPDAPGTNYPPPNNNCPPTYDQGTCPGLPASDKCCQQQCYDNLGQPQRCQTACAVVASSQPIVKLQFPNKTKDGLQFSFQGVAVGNDPRNTMKCPGGNYYGTATVDCDDSPGATDMIITSVQSLGCHYAINLKATAACSANPYVPIPITPEKGWGAGSVFVFIVFLSFVIYFILGTFYMGVYQGKWEIPHKSFWTRCWNSVVNKCRSCATGGGGASDYNDFGNSSSSYSKGGASNVNGYNGSLPGERTIVYDDL